MLETFNGYLWIVVTLVIFLSGLYFSFKTKFIHFRFKELKRILKKPVEAGYISPWQSLMMNLAARIGVGSISGIALAVYIGGPGTIFWMWITAFFASSNTFVESVLGRLYNEKDEANIYKGGPSFYIEKGLGKKNLAKLYSLIIIISFVVGFLAIQSNTISIGISEAINVSQFNIGIILAIITGLVIIKGVKSIARFTDFLVPFMGIIYFIVCMIIIVIRFDILPQILIDIFIDAFKIKSAGVGIITTFIIGMQRGIFSNEAGIGTGAIAAGVTNSSDKCEQGFIQSFGVIFDTLVIGTISGLVVLSTNYMNLIIEDANGIEISKYAFHYHLGDFGINMLLIIIVLFAFASIVTGYYYGESSLKFLIKNISNKTLLIFKLFTLLVLFIGTLVSSTMIWNLVDIFIGILAIINIYAIVSLRKSALNIIKDRKNMI